MEKTLDTLQIEIEKANEGLSKESRAAINAVSWKLIISGMNKKYNPEQLDILEMETELLLCGLVNPETYSKELESEMKISRAEVGTLINELDKLIFKKIAQELEGRLNGGPDKIMYTNKAFIPDPLFVSLPEELQKAISYSNWRERLYDVSKKFKLNIEQTGALEQITIKVILNTVHSDKFEDEIRSKIDLGDDKIKEIVEELNDTIFKNIKGIMEGSLEENKKVPLPPYKGPGEVVIDKVPVPPGGRREAPKMVVETTPITINEKDVEKKPAQKEIEDIISNHRGSGRTETDMYKEHGIEILSENEVIPEIKRHENNMPSPSMGITEESLNKNNTNILADKLSGNTTSKTTVSNYSLPKVNNEAVNTHDPYHEQI